MPDGNLHEYATEAYDNLEKLATGLAQEGASPETVQAVEQMAAVTKEIVKALGKGQESTGDEEPPESEEGAQPQSFDQAAAETSQAMQASAAERKS